MGLEESGGLPETVHSGAVFHGGAGGDGAWHLSHHGEHYGHGIQAADGDGAGDGGGKAAPYCIGGGAHRLHAAAHNDGLFFRNHL